MYVTSQRWPAPVPIIGGNAQNVAAIARPVTSETLLHKFDIRSRSARYLASGTVTGTLLNQYAMSEFKGYLRVATTTGPGVSRSTESRVTVFAQRGPALVAIGSVGGLGKGEQLRAVRFVGPLGYVVTFRLTDPLYTIDLSKPASPKVAAELKMPGYSAYLHPVGDGLLVGVGTQTDAHGNVRDPRGNYLGTKVSLFDVHDPAHPIEVATHVVSGLQSLAEYDYHAFLWWAPLKLVVIPEKNWSSYDPGRFEGAVALRVGRPIAEAGRIKHPDSNGRLTWIVRSLVVGDSIITLSFTGLAASDIHTFARRAWVPLQG
jgi:uncharacterized secreted protein with C-terminal beta-propeller domain